MIQLSGQQKDISFIIIPTCDVAASFRYNNPDLLNSLKILLHKSGDFIDKNGHVCIHDAEVIDNTIFTIYDHCLTSYILKANPECYMVSHISNIDSSMPILYRRDKCGRSRKPHRKIRPKN